MLAIRWPSFFWSTQFNYQNAIYFATQLNYGSFMLASASRPRLPHVELGAHVALKMLNRVLIERRDGLRFNHFAEVRAARAFTENFTAS